MVQREKIAGVACVTPLYHFSSDAPRLDVDQGISICQFGEYSNSLFDEEMLKNLPVFVGVKTDQADKDNSILAGVNAVVFPFPSSVELVGPLASGKAQAPGAKLWTLAATSPEAWKQTGFFFFSPIILYFSTRFFSCSRPADCQSESKAGSTARGLNRSSKR